MKKISLRATALAVAALAAGQAWATNGMLMEGYGPIALSMGGAAQAYDNGTAGMMNNVATLQLGENGTRADVALGILGPNVAAGVDKSSGTSYLMPAVGWVKKNSDFSYGVGMFGQGGMGTEYSSSAYLSGYTGASRSELGVGRLIVPVSYKVNDALSIGASVDYSWAGLDMQMGASHDQLAQMLDAAQPGMSSNFPSSMFRAAIDGAAARISFSDGSDFSGAAKGAGWTGKLGLVFQAAPGLKLGLSHQLKTNLSDLKTNSVGAKMSMYMVGAAQPTELVGQMVVKDFQMPSVTAFGASFEASPKLLLVADVKSIGWKAVMDKFSMTFNSPDLAGWSMTSLSFAMPQQWKNQTVLSFGGSYKWTDATTLRAGYSHSTNPVPDMTVHPLFPAIIKNHFTFGFGTWVSKNMSLDVAVSHAPKVQVHAAQMAPSTGLPSDLITHSQTNYQLMLSYRY